MCTIKFSARSSLSGLPRFDYILVTQVNLVIKFKVFLFAKNVGTVYNFLLNVKKGKRIRTVYGTLKSRKLKMSNKKTERKEAKENESWKD